MTNVKVKINQTVTVVGVGNFTKGQEVEVAEDVAKQLAPYSEVIGQKTYKTTDVAPKAEGKKNKVITK